MNRRTVIAGLGSLAASGLLAVGSGAFTSTSVNRSVSIRTAADYDAVLTLKQRGTGHRSIFDGTPSELEFEIPSSEEGEYPTDNPTDPDGLGTDSVYRFGQDAAADQDGLFSVENQGTHSVEVYSTQPKTSGVPSVTIFDVATGNKLTKSSPSPPLDVGEKLLCGLEIDTHGVDVRAAEYELTLTINAVASED